MKLSRFLYKAARVSRNLEAVAGGPKPAARRGKNIVVGRTLARTGVWNKLWSGGGKKR